MTFSELTANVESRTYGKEYAEGKLLQSFPLERRTAFKMKIGTCNKCGKPTVHSIGHWHCEDCAQMAIRAQEWEWRQDKLKMLVASGMMPRTCLRTERNEDGSTSVVPWYTFGRSNSRFEAQDRAAWADAREWAGDKSVIIWSPTNGNGKTDMARRMMFGRMMDHGESIAEINAVEFVSRTTGFQALGVVDFAAAHVMLLDDMDKGAWTAATLGKLLRVLDDRRDLGLPTIVTTNYPPRPDGLIEFLRGMSGKNSNIPIAILDRLKPVLQIEMTGPSIRGHERSEHREPVVRPIQKPKPKPQPAPQQVVIQTDAEAFAEAWGDGDETI